MRSPGMRDLTDSAQLAIRPIDNLLPSEPVRRLLDPAMAALGRLRVLRWFASRRQTPDPRLRSIVSGQLRAAVRRWAYLGEV